MNAEQKVGCLNCRNTKVELGSHEFQILTGQPYQVYFCYPCFALFQKEMDTVSPAKQVECLHNLSKLINGQVFG